MSCSLSRVIISDSVKQISGNAFGYCNNLREVYFHGTDAEWNIIVIGSSNDNLTNATRYYYSESQPTEEGRFWHFDADGKNILIW